MGGVSIYPWSAIPFGIVWTNLHALNLFIDDKLNIYFVEPQKGLIQDSLEAWQGETVQLIVI
jgi:hypothetical protein